MEKSQQYSNNVFSGSDALKNFLNPDCNPPLPLVELPGRLNPFADQKVRIFAKVMYLLPLLNSKSLPVLNMLDTADKHGGVHTIVENSSGNTAFSLAIMAPLFGIHTVRAMVPLDIAPGKLELLRLETNLESDVRQSIFVVVHVDLVEDLGIEREPVRSIRRLQKWIDVQNKRDL